MVVVGAFGWVSLNGIRFVVQNLGGDAAMGLLAVGWSLGQRLAGVTAMLVTAAAFPLAVRRLATHSHEDAMRLFAAGGTLLFGLVVPAAVGLWQIAPTLVDLMIAEPFRATTLAILPATAAAGAIRNFRVHYADQSFLLFEKTEVSMWINGFEAVMVVGLSTLGYYENGIAGAVWGCLAATIIAALITFVVARAKFSLPLPVLDWARILLATAAMSGALHVIQFWPWPHGDAPRLAVAVVAGTIVYVVALGLLLPLRTLAFARSLGDRLRAPPAALAPTPNLPTQKLAPTPKPIGDRATLHDLS
jgi:O-antigen/teichoic acid export membrane protein